MAAFGAVDLFSGSNTFTGTNLWQIDKNPLNEIDTGVEDVIGKHAQNAGMQILQPIQLLIDSLLGINPQNNTNPINLLFTEVYQVMGDFLSMFGLSGYNSGSSPLTPGTAGFNIVSAVTNFIENFLKPTNLLAPLEQLVAGVFTVPNLNIPGLDASKITSGQFPQNMIIGLETALLDLGSGNVQAAWDAILASVGVPAGSGTQTQTTQYFNDLLSMLGLPSLTSSTFNPVTAVETFITDMVNPTKLLAPLEQLFPGSFTIPMINIPGLDASKVTSGQFPQNMIIGLETDLANLGNAISTGNVQAVWDAILSTVGIPTGSGTQTQTTQYFNDLLSMLGLPALTSSGFNPVTAVENFITSLMQPTNLLAPMNPSTQLLNPLNVPGLDASKITSGTFAQNMVTGLVTDLAGLLPINTWMLREIAGLNLVISPAFTDSSIKRETYGPATVGYDTTHSHTGGQSMKIVSGGGTSGLYLLPHDVAGANARDPKTALRVQPSQRTFYIEGWVYNLAGNVTGGTTALMAFCRDSLGINAPTTVTATSGAPPAAGAFTKMSGTFTVPTGYDLMWPAFQISGIPSGNALWFDSAAVLDETSSQNIIDTVTTAMGVPGLGQTLDAMGTALQNIPGVNIATTLLASVIPGLDASKIVSGILSLANVPNLPAGQITSGTFLSSLIPGLDATKITSGTFPQNMLNITSIAAGIITGTLGAGNIPGLDASKIISGVLANATIPNITLAMSTDMTTIVNGINAAMGLLTGQPASSVQTALTKIPGVNIITTLLASVIPGLDASKIISGVLTTGQIPNLDASKIVSGVLSALQIPGLDATKITSGVFPQNMLNITSIAAGIITGTLGAGQIPGLDASKIISGVLSVASIPNITAAMSTDMQSIVDQVYQAMHGGTSTGNLVSTVKTALLNIPGGNIISTLLASVIPSLDASKITSGTLLSSLIPGLDASKIVSGAFSAAQIPGLDATKITSGVFPQNMVNITSIAAGIVTGVLGAGQIPGLDASKIISGVLSVASIPNITKAMSTDMQSIIDMIFQSTQGGSSTGNTIASVKTSLLNIPGINIISTLLSGVIPSLDASKITSGTFLSTLIPGLDASKIVSGAFGAAQIPGLDASKIISGLFAQSQVSGLPAALASMLTSSSALNAQNLFNQVPSALLGMIPYSHVGGGSPNLISMPGFDSSGSITGNPNWTWNNSDGHTSLGCAQTTANGTLLTLVSNVIPVAAGQQMTLGGWVKYTGLAATAGQNALRINVAGYLGQTPVTTQMVTGIASPSGSSGWVQMTGNWTVPAGVDNIVVQLQVTQAATAGTVAYDDASATKTGLMSGNWMSGISGTVAADIQSAVDQIFQASGGSGTGNPLSSILGSLTDFPGANITSLLAGGVIPGLDASKIVTGVLGTGQVPNITLPMSTDLQGLNDYITNTLVGVVGLYSQTGLPQSNASMTQLYNNLSTNTTNIQSLRSTQAANAVSGGGVNVSINFSNYPDGPLPTSFTTTYSGSGTSALGIKSGNAGWSPLNNDGNRTAITVYNVAPTNTDYQIVRGTMASAPGGATSGGQPRIGAIGRVNSPSSPTSYVWARAYCTGFLTYKADVGCTVAGVDTVFASGIALTWSMDISVIIGANANPRRYQAYSGTQLVFDYTEAGTTSQLGAGFRYWGAKTEMKTGSGGAGNPGTIGSTSVSDNAPPTVLGSTFRISRHSTTNVNYSNSGLTAPAKLPTNFFDTLDFASPDMTWDGLNLTINTEGTYLVNVRYKAANIPSNSKVNGVVWINNVVARQLGSNFADSYLANSGDGIIGSALIYVHAGDYLNFGYASNGAGTITGEGTGTTSYVEVALTNRSMY